MRRAAGTRNSSSETRDGVGGGKMFFHIMFLFFYFY